jgi:hypothetical protein
MASAAYTTNRRGLPLNPAFDPRACLVPRSWDGILMGCLIVRLQRNVMPFTETSSRRCYEARLTHELMKRRIQ